MSKETLKNDLKRLKNAVETSPSICPHCAPLGLQFEPNGALRRTPKPCELCNLPREITMIAFLDTEPEPSARAVVPDWFRPSFDAALNSDIRIYIGIDLDLI